MEARDTKKKDWIDLFLDEITKDPKILQKNIGPFEKAVSRASEVLALAHNAKFTAAIALFVKEIFAYGTDRWNKRYYYLYLQKVLKIFREELAFAFATYEEGQSLRDWVDIRYIAKSAQILEEARLTNFMEEEDYE